MSHGKSSHESTDENSISSRRKRTNGSTDENSISSPTTGIGRGLAYGGLASGGLASGGLAYAAWNHRAKLYKLLQSLDQTPPQEQQATSLAAEEASDIKSQLTEEPLDRHLNGRWYSDSQKTLFLIVDDIVYQEVLNGVESRDESGKWPKVGRLPYKNLTSLTLRDCSGFEHTAEREPPDAPRIIQWDKSTRFKHTQFEGQWRRVLLNGYGSYGSNMTTPYDEKRVQLVRQVNGNWYSPLQRTLYMIVDDTVFEEMYNGVESRDESNRWPRKAGRLEVKSPTTLALTESNGAVHDATRDPDTPWILTLHLRNEGQQLVADQWYKVWVDVNRNGGHYVWEITHDNETITITRPPPPTPSAQKNAALKKAAGAVALAGAAIG